MRYIAAIIFTILLMACSKGIEAKIEEMVTAKNKWLIVSEGKNYTYTMIITGHHINAIRTIEVISGKAANTQPKELATIQSLFNYAFDTIKNTDNEIEITYDSKYGYPNKIKINVPGVVDGNSTIIVQDLVLK